MTDHTRATLARKSYARCYKVTMDLSDGGEPEGERPGERLRGAVRGLVYRCSVLQPAAFTRM